MRIIAIACLLIASSATSALAQSDPVANDPRGSDATLAPPDPGDRYSTGKGDWTTLGRERPHTAELGANNPFAKTIGSTIGSAIGSTIGPR